MVDEEKYYFDEVAADKVCRFFENYLHHSKDPFAGMPFLLEEWQRDFLRKVFGWKRKSDGLRRYRTAYMEIPRKNGKSTLCAGIALYLLYADGQKGAEVYSCAGETEQAAQVFDEAKLMVLTSPALAKRTKPYRRSLVHMHEGLPVGKYVVLSADAKTKHGKNASGIIFDELHVQPNRDLYDTMKTSTGSRTEPMFIMITTAGFDRNSICWEVHEYAVKNNDPKSELNDEAFLGVIYAADEKDDWKDPAVWRKANPNFGISLREDVFEQDFLEAQESPAYENTFKRLHLNIWTEQETRFVPMDKWDACGEPFDVATLKGRECYGGLDLSTRYDLTAFVLVFPPIAEKEPYKVLCEFFIPKIHMMERIKRDKVPYDVWVREGYVTATEGNIIDHRWVEKRAKELNEIYKIKEIAFDRWGAVEISTALQDAGFEMTPFGQGMASMSPPMKESLSLLLDKKLAHGGNPVLRWNATAVSAKQDPSGNVKPVKPDRQKSANRIDGFVAMLMALDRAMRCGVTGGSVYDKRGFDVW